MFKRALVRVLEYLTRTELSELRLANAKIRGNALDSWQLQKERYQSKCTHRKGGNFGNLRRGSWPIDGTSHQYAVLKHQMMNGDWFINCLRCGKKWKPPIRAEFKSFKAWARAWAEYKLAVDFPTNNTSSTAIQMRFQYRFIGKLAASWENWIGVRHDTVDDIVRRSWMYS